MDHQQLVMCGQDVWATLCHEYGHAVFLQFADILETGKANKNIIKVLMDGSGVATNKTKRKIKSDFLDVIVSLSGISAARFAAKGYRIFEYQDTTLANSERAAADIEKASGSLHSAGVSAEKVKTALETIVSVLEVFFALIQVFNFYDWQIHLLANDDPSLKYFPEPLNSGFFVHIMPDHYASLFEYEPEPKGKSVKESILRFIDLRQLALDIGVTKITF